MDIWNILEFVGGICLFLFGMNLMGAYLEKAAGTGLKNILGKLTGGRFTGFLTGAGVTAVIQSSSATTVMVVGFVNSGLLTLSQAINVIMGANVGTTITSWVLSLSGLDGNAWYIEILKPSSFTPVLSLIGILLYMGAKSGKKRDIGVILLGFSVLMFGMDTMSAAVSGLRTDAGFASILTMFTNPMLGVIAGAALTAALAALKKYAPAKGGKFEARPAIDERTLFDDATYAQALGLAEKINGAQSRIQMLAAEQNKFRTQKAALIPWLPLEIPLETVSTEEVLIQFVSIPDKNYNYPAVTIETSGTLT